MLVIELAPLQHLIEGICKLELSSVLPHTWTQGNNLVKGYVRSETSIWDWTDDQTMCTIRDMHLLSIQDICHVKLNIQQTKMWCERLLRFWNLFFQTLQSWFKQTDAGSGLSSEWFLRNALWVLGSEHKHLGVCTDTAWVKLQVLKLEPRT